MSSTSIQSRIHGLLPDLKIGTLRMWGEWFGKPYDYPQKIIDCTGDDSLLTLGFEGGSSLQLWEPRGLDTVADVFSISGATKVRWEWDYQGRPKRPENRYFREFVQEGSVIHSATNVDWYSPKFEPSARHHAAELL